jgi:tyrosine-protein phosphatase SIW14
MRPGGRLAVLVAVPALMLALASGASAAAPTTVSTIGIDNFGQINERYYRGAQPKGDDYTDLATLGVKTVIDLTENGERQEQGLVEAAGMKFYRIPMTTHETPSKEKLARFLGLVSDPANQPVYVHCQGGRHRTGVMTAVYRMTNDHWTADRAFAEMKKFGYGADFLHPEFKRFVYAYAPPEPAPSETVATVASLASTAVQANR